MNEQVAHYVYQQGEWILSTEDTPSNLGSCQYISTVIKSGTSRRLIIISPVNKRIKPKNWPSTDKYLFPGWAKRNVKAQSPYQMRVVHFNGVDKAREVATNVSIENGTLQFTPPESEPDNQRLTHPCMVDIQFKTQPYANSTFNYETIFLRATLVGKSTTADSRLNAFSEKVLRRLLTTLYPDATKFTKEVVESVAPSNSSVSNNTKVEPHESSPQTHSLQTPIPSALSRLLDFLRGRLENRKTQLPEHIKKPSNSIISLASAHPRYGAMSVLTMMYTIAAVYFRLFDVRNHAITGALLSPSSGESQQIRQELSRPSGVSQFVLAVLTLFTPFLLYATGHNLRNFLRWYEARRVDLSSDEIRSSKVRPREKLTPNIYGTVMGLRGLLEYLVFSLLMYFLFSAIAWPDVSDQTHHWVWNDRQSVGFVFTILVSIFAALFSNSLRDLSQENNQMRDQIDGVMTKSRHYLNELHEISDRFWAEFEVNFKEDGKVLLFKANEYAKKKNKTNSQFAIQPLLGGLLHEVERIRQSNESGDARESHFDDLVRTEPAWTMGTGVVWPKRSKAIPWKNHFYETDIPNKANGGVDLSPEELLERVTETNFTNTDEEIRNNLLQIAQRFTSESDGRFCVLGNLDDAPKQSLGLQRKSKALVASFPNEEGKNLFCWGYYPTDESVTLSFIELMLQDSDWLASPDGQNFETWIHSVYHRVADFGYRNRKRLERMNDLLNHSESLMGDQALPSSLLLDDLSLFAELLQTGSDDFQEHDHPLNQQQLKTTARILTYASTFYFAVVWPLDSERNLLPTFPSPFKGLEIPMEVRNDPNSFIRHPSARFALLAVVAQAVLKGAPNPQEFDDPVWAMTLELSNRQGPMTNWIRAGRAYRSREAFLFSQRTGWKETGLIAPVPEMRKELMKFFFPAKGGKSLDVEENFNNSRARELLETIPRTGGKYHIVGPRSLKISRKSSVKSTLRTN